MYVCMYNIYYILYIQIKKVVYSGCITKLFHSIPFHSKEMDDDDDDDDLYNTRNKIKITYARYCMRGLVINVVRSMVPVCRAGITSLSCFLMGPNTGSLILT